MPKASDKKQARPADESSGASLSDAPALDPVRLAAAMAVGITYDEVFAFRDYGDHYVVVTVAGQKQRGEK